MNFEKVSYEQFKKDLDEGLPEEIIQAIYDNIKLPKRATQNSAGYDFFAPYAFKLPEGQSILIPTGIKCKLEPNLFLGILPRSSFGIKYGITLANTMGVIDADYYNNPKNEGHIFVKLINNGKELSVLEGEAFCQGIIQQYFKTNDDNTTAKREGGIGSTSEVKNANN
jgi:dUTP pyrophosphatase